MTQLKDVLHLYLGCDIRWKPWTTMKEKLTTEVLNVIEYDDLWSQVKPLLRPLSSITDEEAIEFSRIDNWYTFESDEDRIQTTKNIIKENEFHPEVFPYLLKKGFDLFGLIESGQALDITITNR